MVNNKTTSDKKIVKTSPIEVSPVSTLPPGLDEGKYRGADLLETGEGGEVEVSGSGEDENDLPPEVKIPIEPGSNLDYPKNIFLKEQRFWFGDAGIPFVDATIGADNVKGATGYEVRFAPVI